MITGAHFLFFSANPEADRAFLRDVLKFDFVDAGEGWLIFALPPAELAVHPAGDTFVHGHAGHELLGAVLYLMCTNLASVVRQLEAAYAPCTPIGEAEWGAFTMVTLPSGGKIGLYQPSHPTAIGDQEVGSRQ